MVDKGYKVAVIEHLERSRDKIKRLKIAEEKNKKAGFNMGRRNSSFDKKSTIIKRELVRVLTKGTFFDLSKISYETRYILGL